MLGKFRAGVSNSVILMALAHTPGTNLFPEDVSLLANLFHVTHYESIFQSTILFQFSNFLNILRVSCYLQTTIIIMPCAHVNKAGFSFGSTVPVPVAAAPGRSVSSI